MIYSVRNGGNDFKFRLNNEPVKNSQIKNLKEISVYIPKNWGNAEKEDFTYWLSEATKIKVLKAFNRKNNTCEFINLHE